MTAQLSRTTAARAILSPPGDTLLETIETLGISQTELSERMGRPLKLISEIIKSKAQITADTALQLENVLGIPATFWLERERRYQLEVAKIKQDEALLADAEWAIAFPFSSMVKLGWIAPATSPLAKVRSLCSYFGVANAAAWAGLFMETTSMLNFRISLAHNQTPYAISAWLRKGDFDAQRLQLPLYDKTRFEKNLKKSLELAYAEPSGFLEQLQILCAEAGVALIFTPCLPKAPVNGCARWLGDRPIIQLSGRYKTNDRFWFTFFHEACHIMRHGKKGYFLEEVSGVENEPEKEAEADRFATDLLVPHRVFIEISSTSPIYEAKTLEYAKRFGIHPGILVGRLQHEKVLDPSWQNHLKSTINLFDNRSS